MRESWRVVRGERGIPLGMALLVLLVVGILGAIMMMTLSGESRLASYSKREATALNIAEAGVGEACARISHQDMLWNTANPREVAQVFNVASGSVPVLGADSTAFATAQPAGAWLAYSSATRGPDVQTAEFKTDRTRTAIIRYDPALSPPLNTATGYPVYRITSTGRVGSVKRRVVAEVISKPINLNIHAALAANRDIRFVGNAVVCGYDHRADTDDWDGENGRGSSPDCLPHEQAGGHLPGSWNTGTVINGGGAFQNGQPVANSMNNTGFYAGPWECLGMQQAEFWPWIGGAISTAPGTPQGIYYLDNDGIRQNQSGDFAYHSTTGEGLLYVDGDLHVNSSFRFRGIVYVEGDFIMNGQCWILGAVIVKGKSEVRQNGGATLLYSSETIRQVLARYGGQFVNLSWVESTP